MAVCFNLQKDLYEPECLTRFVEVGCSPLRNSVAVGCNLEQFSLSCRIRAYRRQLSCFCSIAVCKIDGSSVCNNDCFIEVFLLDIFRITGVKFFHGINYLFNNSGKTNIKNLAVINAYMAYAAVEIITYGKYAVSDAVLCFF